MAVARKLKTYLPFAHLQQVATSSTPLYSPPSVYSPKLCSFVCLCKNCKLPSKLFTNILCTWEILLTHTGVVSWVRMLYYVYNRWYSPIFQKYFLPNSNSKISKITINNTIRFRYKGEGRNKCIVIIYCMSISVWL